MALEEVKDRDESFLREVIKKYKIQYSLEELLQCDSIYINFGKEWVFRVFGNLKIDGGLLKKINIYNFLKSKRDWMKNEEEIFQERDVWILFILYYKQLKIMKEIEDLENLSLNVRNLSSDHNLKKITK